MPNKPTDIVVLVTTGSEEEAVRIARAAVEARLAACANILSGIRSVYRWEGKIADEREVLLILKSRSELFEPLEAEVKRLHSYKTPEIIALPIQEGSAQYLEWIHSETSKSLKNKANVKRI